MTQPRDIGWRLENWARWVSDDGPRPGMCMVGRLVHRKEREEQPVATVCERRRTDEVDAVLIGRAMVRITIDQRRLLGLHYVDEQRDGFIAALLRFPAPEFDRRMAIAQHAVEAAAAVLSKNSDSH